VGKGAAKEEKDGKLLREDEGRWGRNSDEESSSDGGRQGSWREDEGRGGRNSDEEASREGGRQVVGVGGQGLE
jgi:hypothetical protein